MRVLYIGGTGEISFECVHESVRLGHEVSVFNRGNNNTGLPPACHVIAGDANDDTRYRQLAANDFDVVCQFRLFAPADMQRDLSIFSLHDRSAEPHVPDRDADAARRRGVANVARQAGATSR
jgi:hypothetical protein